MKRFLASLLVGMLLCGICLPSIAEDYVFEGRFDVYALLDYAIDEGTPAYDLVTFGTENQSAITEWEYSTYDSTMHYDLTKGSVNGETDVSIFLTGFDTDIATPWLYLDGNADKKFTPKLLQLRTNDHLYWMDLKRAKDTFFIEKDGDGNYDFDLIISLGTAGEALMNDLYAANFAFALRVYDGDGLCFAFEQEMAEDEAGGYRLFYEGLRESDFIDAQGKVQYACWTVYQKLDETSTLPRIAIYPPDEKLWLADGETAVPKTVKSIKAIEAEERPAPTTLEFTGMADWGRSKQIPWVKHELRNTDKKKTVTAIGLLYFCTDKDGAPLANEETDMVYNQITLEQKLKPKKKVMLSKYSFSGYDAEARNIYTAIQSVTYSDGTTVTVADRDLSFQQIIVK